MKIKDKVSVVIPFFNCPFVHLAVESALAQSYKSLEIIVVDDGSTLHTEKLLPYKGDIIYLRKPNEGTATALNCGIKAATGSYFAWLSSDDLFHPDKIQSQVELLSSSGTSFCHTGFFYINSSGERLSEVVLAPFRNRVHFIETLMQGCPVNGSSVLLDMDIFNSVGHFNEKFKYTHDYELWLRILPHYEWSYLDKPLLDYRVHELMGSVIHAEAQKQEIEQVQLRHYGALSRLLDKERLL